MSKKSKGLRTKILITLLVFLYPIGLIMTWTNSQWKKRTKILLTIPFVILLMFILIWNFAFSVIQARGQAMEPTVMNGQYMLINKLAGAKSITHKSIIVFKRGDGIYFGRVIGMPSDNITLENNLVSINDRLITEAYLLPDMNTYGGTYLPGKYESVVVPDNSLFVMGDNRIASNDSRYFGPISKNDVVGEVAHLFPCPDKPSVLDRLNHIFVKTYPPQVYGCNSDYGTTIQLD